VLVTAVRRVRFSRRDNNRLILARALGLLDRCAAIHHVDSLQPPFSLIADLDEIATAIKRSGAGNGPSMSKVKSHKLREVDGRIVEFDLQRK
jgi:hypothetical protein